MPLIQQIQLFQRFPFILKQIQWLFQGTALDKCPYSLRRLENHIYLSTLYFAFNSQFNFSEFRIFLDATLIKCFSVNYNISGLMCTNNWVIFATREISSAIILGKTVFFKFQSILKLDKLLLDDFCSLYWYIYFYTSITILQNKNQGNYCRAKHLLPNANFELVYGLRYYLKSFLFFLKDPIPIFFLSIRGVRQYLLNVNF